MLNPFPELLSYGLLAPLILRMVLGIIFINLGFLKLGREKKLWTSFLHITPIKPAGFWLRVIALVQIVGGLMLVAGFYTQIAALVFSIITIFEIYVENREPVLLNRNLIFYILILSISLSLLFSGAGFLSIDLPL